MDNTAAIAAKRERIKRLCRAGAPGLLAFALAACNLLTPIVFVGEHKKRVLPEFDKLPGKRVAVLVWTEPATLFDYPYARFELATYIADKLQTEMAQRTLGTVLVDPRDVDDFLQSRPDAQVDPLAVGRKFDADYVVFVEILRMQIRDPDEPQLLQGRIDAAVSVHHVRATAGDLRRYDLAPVVCAYPEAQPVVLTATNSALVRDASYRKFAELVAAKFYEHLVDL
jgi:hypothetical protein